MLHEELLRTGRKADNFPDGLGDERHEFLEQILHDSCLNPGDRHDRRSNWPHFARVPVMKDEAGSLQF
jgi:hypothetical protein